MLRSIVLLAVSMTTLAVTQAHADVYKDVDANGNVKYTDKPEKIPAVLINVRTQKTDVVAMQERQQAEMQRLQDSNAARQQTAARSADDKAAAELTSKDKAERCTKARERYDSYMTSQRLYEQQKDGERRYLTDAELTAARTNAKTAMEELCK